MISHRSFLLGIGSLVTTSFVARARAHVRERGTPLLLHPKRAEETLYLYEGFGLSDGPWATKYRVSLGPDQWPAPPPPTWREHLTSLGYRFETQADCDRACCERSLTPEELDKRIDGYSWEDYWDHYESPQAKAHQLLKDLDLDCDPKAPGSKAGRILFTDWGGHPGSSERWVDLKEELSVSILQARLIERDLSIKLVLESL
jgi:hypothetical protein